MFHSDVCEHSFAYISFVTDSCKKNVCSKYKTFIQRDCNSELILFFLCCCLARNSLFVNDKILSHRINKTQIIIEAMKKKMLMCAYIVSVLFEYALIQRLLSELVGFLIYSSSFSSVVVFVILLLSLNPCDFTI